MPAPTQLPANCLFCEFCLKIMPKEQYDAMIDKMVHCGGRVSPGRDDYACRNLVLFYIRDRSKWPVRVIAESNPEVQRPPSGGPL